MARAPKEFYSDTDTTDLIQDYASYRDSPHVPSESVKGVLTALLQRIPIANLNIESAVDALMADLLYDNRELEKLAKGSTTALTALQRKQRILLVEQLLERNGERRVASVLAEYSSHSIVRMREESDVILQRLQKLPAGMRDRREWLDKNLPSLLQCLEENHACFKGCARKTVISDEDLDGILTPVEANGNAAIKNAILAHFHGLSALRVRDYLEGKRPKTQSRSR